MWTVVDIVFQISVYILIDWYEPIDEIIIFIEKEGMSEENKSIS
jgi:hypothetical protein